MTLQTLAAGLLWPGIVTFITGTPGLATDQTLDAAGEYIAYIFCAREAMTLSHVAFRNGAATGSPVGSIRIEDVAADGTPSGNLWAANTEVSTGTLSANTTALYALTASASISKGQMFAVKILYTSGTSFVVQHAGNPAASQFQIPYQCTNTSGSAVKARLSSTKILALGSSTTTFYSQPAICAATAVTVSSFNNTNSAARGLRFQVPFKCRAVGICYYSHTAAGDYNAVMYDDGGTELSSSSTAFDGDHSGSTAAVGVTNVYFDNAVTLSPATWYRAAIEPSSATNCSLTTQTLLSAAYRSGTLFGTNAHYTTRASGSWTDTATDQIPLLDIIIDQLDDGAGAAGGGLKLAGRGGLAG